MKDKLTNKQVVVEVQVVETTEPSLATHFGAYVNYVPDDATWDSSKLSSYGVSETTKSNLGFDIYDLGTSSAATGKAKSQSITCKDSRYKTKYNGWRVLDVSSSGQITLIHAGTPECYYHENLYSTSVTLLETASTSSSPGDSKAWTKYGNATYAQSVHYMTNEDFNLITYQINKNNNYTIKDIADSTCHKKTKFTACGYDHDMIDIGSYYWLASGYNAINLYFWAPSDRNVNNWYYDSYGVRPVVVLKSGLKLSSNNKGTADDPYELVLPELESLSVSPSSISVLLGKKGKISVTPVPTIAKVDLEYTASNNKISVDQDGIVTGIEAGTSSVTVKDKLTNKQVVVEVQVIGTTTPSLATHFGKYVNYTPTDSTWASSKLSSYGVSETETTTQGKFNIYDYATSASAKGKAKSQSITCYNSSYKNKYNGWRVLDVSSSGVITLIHAGTPECYYHGYGYSSASVKRLETASTSSSPGDSKAWTKYGNATYAQSVHYMTNEDFNLITYQINKNNNYTITDNGEGNSTCYYKTESTACGYNHDMIDIGSYYWLASAYNTYSLYLWGGASSSRFVNDWYSVSYGVRPVVVLKSGVKFLNDGRTGSSESNALNLVAP